MSTDLFLAPVAQIREPALALSPSAPVAAPATGEFGSIVNEGLRHLSEQLQSNQVDLRHLATGDVQNLHQIMIRLEETRISFQLMLQVRNRVLESFQEVMRMPV
jgi:flagellar hook-basal body complex protein FliE